MAFWTDIFTLETWAQAGSRGYTVTGFPAPTSGRGGYGARQFERVAIGDVLLCYCKSPAPRWVGALLVAGPVFRGMNLSGDLQTRAKRDIPGAFRQRPSWRAIHAKAFPATRWPLELPSYGD